jgi:hypothetical protein
MKPLFKIESGGTPDSKNKTYWDGDIYWATLVDLPAENSITEIRETARKITKSGLNDSSAKLLPVNTVIISSRATIGRVGIARVPLATNQGFKNIIIQDPGKITPEFLAVMATCLKEKMEQLASGGTFKEISKSGVATLEIPLPPLEVQREIVAEIEGYRQKIRSAETRIGELEQKIKNTVNSVWDDTWLPQKIEFDQKLFEICFAKVSEHSIVQGDLLGKTFVDVGIGPDGLAAKMTRQFSDEALESLLVRVRIFLNKGDRVFFENGLKLAKERLALLNTPESVTLTEQLTAAESKLANFRTFKITRHDDKEVTINESGIAFVDLLDLRLNGGVFHNDTDKISAIDARKNEAGALWDIEERSFYMALRAMINLLKNLQEALQYEP